MTNQDLESCKRDIEIIKSTIEKSKVNLGSIAKLFIIYGTTMLLFSLIRRLCLILIAPVYTTVVHQVLTVVNPIVQIAVSLILLFVYLKNYAQLRKTNHFFTLQLYQLWGVSMFALPLLTSAVSLSVELICGNEFYQSFSLILTCLPLFAECIFFLASLLYTGIALNKKTVILSSAVLFALMIAVYFIHPEISQESYIPIYFRIYSYINTRTWLCRMIVFLGYMFVGIYLFPKKEKQHGTE